MTELEAKQAIVDAVGEPWTVADIELKRTEGKVSEFYVEDVRGRGLFVVGRGKRRGKIATEHDWPVGRAQLIGGLTASAMERGVELPYDRVLREKEAVWAEEKAELEGKIEELEEALRIT